MTEPTENEVREALRTVIDPEVGINIVDLGLVYDIAVEPGRITVALTMTTPACPLGDLITGQARDAILMEAPEVDEVDIRLVWDPPWDPAMMSDAARKQLGWE